MRQNNRCTNSKKHSYTNIQKIRVFLTQVAFKFPWFRKKNNLEQSSIEKNLCEATLGCQICRDKILGMKWDKKKDKLNIEIPQPIQKITKRHII